MSQFLIVGGGIIGTAIARELAKRKAGTVTILEKESSLGRHASGRNSGVIHSGINQKPGSVKAQMCVKGSKLLREHCKKQGVPMKECGTLVIARDAQEEEVLHKLLEMGTACEVPGLRMINKQELKDREPIAKGKSALLSPMGATVDSLALLKSLAREARSLGVQYRMITQVLGVNSTSVETAQGPVAFEYLINCAGLQADRIAHAMGVGMQYEIIPFRGEYMEVKSCDVRSMIYRAPDLRYPFLSIHLTRETDGSVLAGPTSSLVFSREAYDNKWNLSDVPRMITKRPFLKMISDPEFLKLVIQNIRYTFSKSAFLEEIQTLAEGIEMNQIQPHRAGIRAQMVDEKGKMVMDLLVSHTQNSTHVLNAVSPGMTCSLAFAEHVVNSILEKTPIGDQKPS